MFRERFEMMPVAQSEDDNQGFARWLQGRPPQGHTIMELKFMTATGKSLKQITLADFQANVSFQAPAFQGRAINAAKSLFSLAQRISFPTIKPRARYARRIKVTRHPARRDELTPVIQNELEISHA